MINPALGRYKTLSAITNPTGKKMFEAGIKGKIIIESPITYGLHHLTCNKVI